MDKDIQDTREMLVALNELTLFLCGQFKDGFQLSDFMAVYSKMVRDQDFKEKMRDAFDGVKDIPAELKDLDTSEVIELITVQIAFIPRLIAMLQK